MQSECSTLCVKVDVQLTGPRGPGGNVYGIIAVVETELKRHGQINTANEFTKRALNSHSYDSVLQLCHEYVNCK